MFSSCSHLTTFGSNVIVTSFRLKSPFAVSTPRDVIRCASMVSTHAAQWIPGTDSVAVSRPASSDNAASRSSVTE